MAGNSDRLLNTSKRPSIIETNSVFDDLAFDGGGDDEIVVLFDLFESPINAD